MPDDQEMTVGAPLNALLTTEYEDNDLLQQLYNRDFISSESVGLDLTSSPAPADHQIVSDAHHYPDLHHQPPQPEQMLLEYSQNPEDDAYLHKVLSPSLTRLLLSSPNEL